MKSRLISLAKYALYPIFYVFCLLAGIYLSFPWDALKLRVESEFARTQASKGAEAWRLDLGTVDGYWLSGVELAGAKLVIPPGDDEDGKPGVSAGKAPVGKMGLGAKTGTLAKVAGAAKTDPADKDAEGEDADGAKAPRDSVILIEHAHARVKLLPLLIGRVRINFGAELFGGEISGVVPLGGGDLAIDIENIDLSKIAPLTELASVPVQGIANGRLELTSQGKWSKSAGSFNLTITEMVMGDGKAKFRNLMSLPPGALGTFEIEGKADQGVLQISKFGAGGRDVEIHGSGTVKLREPWDASVADLWVRFGFSDEYKNKDDKTKALFVDDPPFPALISQDRKLKRAMRKDGLWGFHVHGRLGRLRYDPTTKDGPAGKAPAAESKTSKAGDDDDDDDGADPAPARPTKPNRPTPAKPTPAAIPEPPNPGIANEPVRAPEPPPPTVVTPIPAPPPPPEPPPEPEQDGPEPPPQTDDIPVPQ